MCLFAIAPAILPAQSFRNTPGQRLVYRLDYRNVTSSDLRALFGFDSSQPGSPLAHNIESVVTADIVRTAIEADSADWKVAYSFREAAVSIRVNGQTDTASSAAVARDLAIPMIARVSASGHVKALAFDGNIRDISKSFARALLAGLQFVMPGDRGRQWETREDDPAGRYIARYERVSRGSYSRTKLRYLPRSISRKGEITVTETVVPSGKLEARLDSEGSRLVSLSGTDSQKVLISERQIAQGVTTLSLRYVRTEMPARSEMMTLVAMAHKAAWGDDAEQSDDRVIHSAELGDETAETLLSALEQRERNSEDTSSLTPLYLKLKALVYLHPGTSALLGTALKSARPNGPTMEVVSGALGSVGHSQAQSALVEAMKFRETEWPAMATLIPALGGARTPASESIDYMFRLAFGSRSREISSTARLAAGTMIKNVEADSPQLASALVKRLVDGMKLARTASEQGELLLALGNTGSASALSVIADFAGHRDPVLRAFAMRALRWVDGERAGALLAKAAGADADSTVRAEAARALSDRTSRRD